MGAVTQTLPATGAFGEAIYGATKRVIGVPILARSRMRFLMYGFWWITLRGHDTHEWCAEMGAGPRSV
eukprot:790251-Pyramimonas_sp.AAC.1